MNSKSKLKLLVGILTITTIFSFNNTIIGLTEADSGLIKYIYPSGDPSGITDTVNIQAAFDEASAFGSGSTVILSEGVFLIAHPILVVDFDGTFKGQGKDKTIVMNYFDENTPFPLEPRYYNYPLYFPSFFSFHLENKGINPENPANLRIADMTLKTIGHTEYHFWGGWVRVDYSFWNVFQVDIYNNYYDVKFNGIEIKGEYVTNPDGHYVPNLWAGISVWDRGPSTSIKNCYVENCMWPFEIGYTPNSGIKITENTIKNSFAGIRFISNYHLDVLISQNTFLNSPAFWTLGDEGGLYSIKHNDIIMPEDSYMAGIEAAGFYSFESPTLIISHNKIHSEDSLFFGPIYMEGIHDSTISHNIITGRGPAAMYLGVPVQTPGVPSSGLKLLMNDVENWEVADYTGSLGVFEGVAPIWLGTGTNNYLVIGRNAKETVFDQGTDNTIIDLP
ncbi:MAG: hypothetical protein ACFFFT_08640 [Candidatus Thorarchaeota archaeon]